MLTGALAKVLSPTPPNLKRLFAEKFEEAEAWFVEEFLPNFNGFATDVVNSLARTVAEEREIAFTTGDPVAVDTKPFPIFIKPQFIKAVRRVTVSCPCVEDGGLPIAAAQVQWRLTSSGVVEVRLITGCDANTAHKMRLLLEP